MKKILILLLIFISVKSFAQYPVTQTLGGDSTLVTSKGGLKGRIIVWAYPDTATANTQRIKQYPYALIATDDHNLWMRNIDATVWILQGTSSGTGTRDTIFVKDDLTVDITTNPGHQTLGRLHDDGYTGGKVTWTGTGLNFVVAPSILYLSGNTYTFPATPLTLTPADLTYSRYDVFALDSLGPFVLTGIPDPTPLVPQVDAGQFALTSGTLINVGDTVPSSVTIEMIYNENLGYPSEWVAQTQGNPSTVNFNSLTNPFLGVKAAFVSSYTNGAQLRFVDYSGLYIRHTVNPLDVLVFALYSNGRFNNQIYAKFYDSSLTSTSNLLISTAQFGFNPNDSNRYQILTIPLSAFNWQRQTYSTLSLQLSGNDTSGAKGFYIDWVNIQSNLNNTPPPTDYSLKQDSNTLVKTIVGSDTLNTVYWWSKGISHALAPIYTHSGGTTIDTTNKWVNDVTYLNDSTIVIWKGATSSTVRTGPGTAGGGGSTQTTNKLSVTATGGQTVVPFAGIPASANDADIFINGAYIKPSYYTISAGVGITLTTGLVAGDIVDYAEKK